MKEHLKKLRPLLLLMALFMLVNCQEDYTEGDPHGHEHENSIVVRKPFSEFKNLPDLMKSTLKRGMQKTRDSLDIYDFAIDSTEVMQVTTDYGRFYTMPITRDFEYPFDMFENLVISDYGDRQEAFIVSYRPAPEFYTIAQGHDLPAFIGDIAITQLDYKELQKTVITTCITVNIMYCTQGDPSGHPVYGRCSDPSKQYAVPIKRCTNWIIDSPVIGGTMDAFKFVNLSPGATGGGGTGGGSSTGSTQITPNDPDQNGSPVPVSPGLSGPVTGPMIITKEQEHKDNCNKLKGLINDPTIKSSLNTLKGSLNQNNERLFSFSKNGSGNTHATPEKSNSGSNAVMKKTIATYGVAHTHQNGLPNNPSGIYKMFSIADLQRVYEFAKDYGGSGITAAPMFFNMMVINDYTYIVFPDDVQQFKNLGSIFEDEDKLGRYDRQLNKIYNDLGNADSVSHQNLAEHFLRFINNVNNNPNLPNLKMSMYRISNENNFNGDWEKLELDSNNDNTLKEPKPCPKN